MTRPSGWTTDITRRTAPLPGGIDRPSAFPRFSVACFSQRGPGSPVGTPDIDNTYRHSAGSLQPAPTPSAGSPILRQGPARYRRSCLSLRLPLPRHYNSHCQDSLASFFAITIISKPAMVNSPLAHRMPLSKLPGGHGEYGESLKARPVPSTKK